jgi:hypothetical protein
MYRLAPHNRKQLHRRTIAGVMALLYVIILLVPLSVNSKHVAHAITGECSGDCEIDGCALESRANHTCCCVKKKLQQSGTAKAKASVGECCSPKPVKETVVAKGDCCAVPQQTPAHGDCCATNGSPSEHDEDARDEHHAEAQNTNETVYRCSSPCGKGKLQILASTGFSELLPYIYAERILEPPYQETRYSRLTPLMTSRHTEPPEPPPRQPATA